MKPASHFQPTRSSVLYAHTRAMLNSSALCVRKFATLVVEQYMALNAPDQRQVPFRWGGVTIDDLYKAERHNAQVLARYMDGVVKNLPADLEDAWVNALPEPFRSDCERDLARRRGCLHVRVDVEPAAANVLCLGKFMHEAGQLCEAIAPALADGRLSGDDAKHARRIVDESDDVIGAVLSVRHHAQRLLDKG